MFVTPHLMGSRDKGDGEMSGISYVSIKFPPCSWKKSRISKVVFLSHLPIPCSHASPKFIAPRHSGETRTPAFGDRTRCQSSRLFAWGGAPKRDIFV